MAKETYTVELRQIYEVTVEEGQDWTEALDESLRTYYKTGVETDDVTMLHSAFEVLEVTGS
jgi:O-phosphoseryl-tRNA(Cys) synthetase